jgi:hypothetical protein
VGEGKIIFQGMGVSSCATDITVDKKNKKNKIKKLYAAVQILGVCFDEKTGVELNEKMVKEGEALAYVAYSKVKQNVKK